MPPRSPDLCADKQTKWITLLLAYTHGSKNNNYGHHRQSRITKFILSQTGCGGFQRGLVEVWHEYYNNHGS